MTQPTQENVCDKCITQNFGFLFFRRWVTGSISWIMVKNRFYKTCFFLLRAHFLTKHCKCIYDIQTMIQKYQSYEDLVSTDENEDKVKEARQNRNISCDGGWHCKVWRRNVTFCLDLFISIGEELIWLGDELRWIILLKNRIHSLKKNTTISFYWSS